MLQLILAATLIWIDTTFDLSPTVSRIVFSVPTETADLIIAGDLTLNETSDLVWSDTDNGHYSGETYRYPNK